MLRNLYEVSRDSLLDAARSAFVEEIPPSISSGTFGILAALQTHEPGTRADPAGLRDGGHLPGSAEHASMKNVRYPHVLKWQRGHMRIFAKAWRTTKHGEHLRLAIWWRDAYKPYGSQT